MGPHGVLRGYINFVYVEDVRTSQGAHLWAPTTFYGDTLSSLYVDDDLTSQEAHIWTSTPCYGG
jgi:hypothetical protein